MPAPPPLLPPGPGKVSLVSNVAFLCLFICIFPVATLPFEDVCCRRYFRIALVPMREEIGGAGMDGRTGKRRKRGGGAGGGGGGGLINNSFAAGRARGDPIPEPFLPSFQSTPFVSLTLSSFAIAAVVLPILPLLAFPQSVVGHWKAKKDIAAYLSSLSQRLE